jgi:uncharacterized phiE125 gp8 family phage protein
VISVDAVKYVNAAGVLTTMSASGYLAALTWEPARIRPVWGTLWPIARRQREAVQVEFKAGYGTSAVSVPAPIRQAILLMLGNLYRFRETQIAGTSISDVSLSALHLLAPFRMGWM